MVEVGPIWAYALIVAVVWLFRRPRPCPEDHDMIDRVTNLEARLKDVDTTLANMKTSANLRAKHGG